MVCIRDGAVCENDFPCFPAFLLNFFHFYLWSFLFIAILISWQSLGNLLKGPVSCIIRGIGQRRVYLPKLQVSNVCIHGHSEKDRLRSDLAIGLLMLSTAYSIPTRNIYLFKLQVVFSRFDCVK